MEILKGQKWHLSLHSLILECLILILKNMGLTMETGEMSYAGLTGSTTLVWVTIQQLQEDMMEHCSWIMILRKSNQKFCSFPKIFWEQGERENGIAEWTLTPPMEICILL